MEATLTALSDPRSILGQLGIAVMVVLVLFGITLVGVGGFFLVRVFREYFRAKPFSAFEKKAAAAIQAADLGWLAIACGPLLGFFISLMGLPVGLLLRKPDDDPYEFPKMMILMIGVGAVAGVFAGGAFWVSSGLLGNVRKATKRLRGVRDPEFDGPV